MYVNAKIISIETIPGIGMKGGGDEYKYEILDTL
jgi:hypothetical protein